MHLTGFPPILHFNPQVPCGTRPFTADDIAYAYLISIHRSLAGPDYHQTIFRFHCVYFNPQVPCGTRRQNQCCLPLAWYFNPQVPCGTRRFVSHRCSASLRFQSTGPLRDPTFTIYLTNSLCTFQSTGPLRDPTAEKDRFQMEKSISIHRSLAGPDLALSSST